ncbi:MAG TPA: gamma-glutamylcyclotransferase family protein [Variovorax sp.]|nr:gamma-glutamylcyclotransferase family protein [Variovorax sp.]
MQDTWPMMPEAPPVAPAARCVFVYGTLRAGGRNDIRRFRPPPQFVGQGCIAGTLYDLGAYPGVRLDGPGQVFGEVWRIDAGVEAQLDLLEGVHAEGTGEYRRCELAVDVGGRSIICLVYEINASHIRGRQVIASGDWMAGR